MNGSPRLGSVMVVLVWMLCLLVAPTVIFARETPGLGLYSGIALEFDGDSKDDDRWSHDFGFLVDLPLLSTFHITPEASLYKIGGSSVTDISMAFKFIILARRARPFLSLIPGITTRSGDRDAHLGVGGGVYIPLAANLSLLVQAKYRETLGSDNGPAMLHLNGGLMFQF